LRKNIQLLACGITLILLFVINGILYFADEEGIVEGSTIVIIIFVIIGVIIILFFVASAQIKKRKEALI
jgi:hypothetical protein